MKRTILITLLLFSFAKSKAQNVENTGWFLWLNSVKFNQHWGAHLDVQFRSANEFDYLRNILIRPGVTYFFNKTQNVTVGYLLAETNRGPLNGTSNNILTEHRIWEQFIQTHKISQAFVTHRFRLEQRFIESPASVDKIYAQRFRYFNRFILPLNKYEGTFSKGAFLALQNEVFLNVQNKSKLNKALFDQNRVYLAAGFRLSPKADLEAGYLNQSINGLTINTVNHAVQLAVYTRF